MPDVFATIPLEKHTGQGPMTVAELRAKYGPGLTFSADDDRKRIVRGWERSQVEVLTLHFVDNYGHGVPGIEGAYFWPDAPSGGVAVVSDGNGNIDWKFSSPSYYNVDAGEAGPYKFVTNGLTISGMGSPSKNHPYNHDSMSFDILVNPTTSAPSPTPDPPPVVTPPNGDAKADLRRAITDIMQAAQRALDALLRFG